MSIFVQLCVAVNDLICKFCKYHLYRADMGKSQFPILKGLYKFQLVGNSFVYNKRKLDHVSINFK